MAQTGWEFRTTYGPADQGDTLKIVLDFVAALSNAWAWPIAIIVIAFIFRKAIKKVIDNLKGLKWGEAEAIFGNELEKLELSTMDFRPPIDLGPVGDIHDPSFSILAAWKKLEARLRDVVPSELNKGVVPISGTPAGQIVRQLEKNGLISRDLAASIDSARRLRNVVVHSNEFKPNRAQALEYVDNVNRVLRELDSAFED